MARHNRADSARHRRDIVEDVPEVVESINVDREGSSQRPRPAVCVDVAYDGHDWRKLSKLFENLRRANITRVDD